MALGKYYVDVIDVSQMDYASRLTAASLQGLANRNGPCVFLDYGIYDDISVRKTNETFLSDELWFSKYRSAIGNIDQNNLEYYRTVYDIEPNHLNNLLTALRKHADFFEGTVVWDPDLQDTVNIALMLGGLENLLVIHPDMIEPVESELGLKIVQDLRGRWHNRISLYSWAFKHLFKRCVEGRVACVEPGWGRTEFADYIVQNRLFVYSLTAFEKGRLFSMGQKLLYLLIGGPKTLLDLMFGLRLDGLVRRAGLALMGLGSAEVRLATRIQRAVKGTPYPTLFGWHTCRDDEISFMVHLSANGMRLIPSHLSGNFSFHGRLPGSVEFVQDHIQYESVQLEQDKVYLTFVLSDGDQMMMMNSNELGNWRLKERGKVPFNWETQPLLIQIAPALLGKYYATLTDADYLIAGPSGAGYVIPPLVPRLKDYLKETSDICRSADIRVITSYIANPPRRVIKQHGTVPGNILGYLAGYAHFGGTPEYVTGSQAFIANKVPHVEHLHDDCRQTLEAVRKLVDEPGPTPKFISVHLFAYRTMISDVYDFVQTLDQDRVKVVRADEFLTAALKYKYSLQGRSKNEYGTRS